MTLFRSFCIALALLSGGIAILAVFTALAALDPLLAVGTIALVGATGAVYNHCNN